MSGLVGKLKIKADQRLLLLNAPPGYLDELGPLPDGTEVLTRAQGQFDLVHLFAQNSAELEELLTRTKDLVGGAALWVSYPKGSSKVETDLTRDQGWDALTRQGFRPVSLISINDIWSAVRFRKKDKADQDPVEVQYAGKKARLRPIYDRLVEIATGLGRDVGLAPRKSYVGLVRGKVFAVIKPSTRTRLDLGLKLPELSASERLLEAPGFGSGSITHKVGLRAVEEVDEQIEGWLRQAYEAAR